MKSHKYKGKTILVIGAGQIGEASAIKFIKEEPKEIILHALTKEESLQAIANIRETTGNNKIVLKPSWGNLLVPRELIHTKKEELLLQESKLNKLIDYYYANLSDDLLENSALYTVIKRWKPSLIIDAINTATVVGYLDDPYSLPRRVIKEFKDKNSSQWKIQCKKILSSAIIPSLIRFTQVIQKALTDFPIEYYVKVSTTGLGGMGMNIMYTHGDLNEPGMSAGILGKVSAAGVFHQLMWGLSHTPGINVRIVVPAALVGWQAVNFGKFRSHGKNLFAVDNIKVKKIEYGKKIEPDKDANTLGKYLEMPYVDSGENCAYSLYEMHAITSLGQMESITKEEVGEAVYESANGSTKYDLLTVMDYATMGPSYGASFQRLAVLKRLKDLEDDKKMPSIATNNLGPTVSKHLFELYIIFSIAASVQEVIDTPSSKLSNLAKELVLSNDNLRVQILSLGLPILFENNEYLRGQDIFVPNIREENIISKESIEKWTDAGWIDLREVRISYWQKYIKEAFSYLSRSRKQEVFLEKNFPVINSGNIGEILGLIYSIQGGERKKQY